MGVIPVDVMRGNINPPTVPSYRVVQLKVTDVHMNNWHERIPRMKHNGNARSKETFLIDAKSFFYRFRQAAMDSRKVYPPPFNQVSILNNTGTASTTAIALPDFFFKAPFTVQSFQSIANFILDFLVFSCNIFFINHLYTQLNIPLLYHHLEGLPHPAYFHPAVPKWRQPALYYFCSPA